MTDQMEAPAAPNTSGHVPEVWGHVPQRNRNFTGREALLDDMRSHLTSPVTAVLAHALYGMGGVGKTQLAIEFAYRYSGDYDLVWWVPADQTALVRSSLAALAPRLKLEIPAGRLEDAVTAVLDALRRGEPYDRWLVIFDNADQPEALRGLIPEGPGQVIVTSRNHRWQAHADTVEVNVFARAESLEFLSRRVPGITDDESNRLAEELGDLPLALEQAGALQAESGMSVDEYLDLLGKESSRLLSENPPADYPVPVAAAWSLSVARLKEELPFALELLRLCSFFGPEPIKRDILKSGRYVLDNPMRQQLGDPILLGRATRELGRYALARVDNNRKTLQVHRLIQRLVREGMADDEAETAEHDVHLLLAAADPDDPEIIDNWSIYDELLAHVEPSDIIGCEDADARRLVRNMVRYLFNISDLATCESFTTDALEKWSASSDPDDVDLLILKGQRADQLWMRGKYSEAFELRSATLDRLRETLGVEHPSTLRVTNGYAADLRARGEFAEALRLDETNLELHNRVFGDDHRTFNLANNLGVDQCLNGNYDAAYRTDSRTREDRLDFFGRDDHPMVVRSLSNMARDLRQGGKYREALELEERAYAVFTSLVRERTLDPDHIFVLSQRKDLAIALRKMGQLETALQQSEDVYKRYKDRFGVTHPHVLAAAGSLGNARRVSGDVKNDDELKAAADELLRATFDHYVRVFGADHPCTHGGAINLAMVRRTLGDLDDARALLTNAYSGLQAGLGDDHHYTLSCRIDLATVLAETGQVEEARQLGEAALAVLRRSLGEDHPHTLACAANLASDLHALGRTGEAEALATDTLERYRKVLPEDHFDVADAAVGKRVAVDFEPPLL